MKEWGRIARGVEVPSLDYENYGILFPRLKKDAVAPGDIIRTVQETPVVEHRIMVPEG